MPPPSLIEHVLSAWHVPFVPLPTGDAEQSDFLVTLGRSRLLIEEKTKSDDPSLLAQQERRLASGRPDMLVKPLVRTNRLSGIVRKAVDQLASSAGQYQQDFALLWFTGTGPHAEAHYRQFIATLYGTVGLIEQNSRYRIPCYIFQNSEFHRYARVLDGAVAAYLQDGTVKMRLCLNPLSLRFNRLARTKFTKLFGTSVENPRAAEREKRAYMLDTATDRRDEPALLRDVQLKYGTGPLQTFNLGYHHIKVRVGEIEA